MNKSTNTKKKSKIVKTREDLIEYIRQLDRLRWEFLRLSETYQKDWQNFIDDYIWEDDLAKEFVCQKCQWRLDNMRSPASNGTITVDWTFGSIPDPEECQNCEKMKDFKKDPIPYLPINAFFEKWDLQSYYKSLGSDKTDVLMKYGIRFFANPSLSYEQVMTEFMKYPDDSDYTLSDFVDFDAFFEKLLESDDKLSTQIRNAIPPETLKLARRQKVSKKKKPSNRDIKQQKEALQLTVLSALNTFLAQKCDKNYLHISELCRGFDKVSTNKLCNKFDFEKEYSDFLVSGQKLEAKRWNDKFIFYTYLHEYSIYEGVYPSTSLEDSPFITLTVNITSPVESSVEEYRKIVSRKRKDFYKRQDSKLCRLKWRLPNGLNSKVTENKLRAYQLYKTMKEQSPKKNFVSIEDFKNDFFKSETGHDFDELFIKLRKDIDNRNLPKDRQDRASNLLRALTIKKDKSDAKVEGYLEQAKEIMAHVEQGIFP